ncbi:hypothetical protein OCU04_005111 [Sclerotinia nivalis]|uniref:Uncharacterized protein n=1 Tax=Sclerotinia nivalis TaxID=352851 RepID=A0A9X0DLI7_9HELO|nr:hypothetical protein OCU04_005111 [Sclerotinia nivalis]
MSTAVFGTSTCRAPVAQHWSRDSHNSSDKSSSARPLSSQDRKQASSYTFSDMQQNQSWRLMTVI